MTLLDEHDAGDFVLYFLGYEAEEQQGKSRGEKEALLEVSELNLTTFFITHVVAEYNPSIH